MVGSSLKTVSISHLSQYLQTSSMPLCYSGIYARLKVQNPKGLPSVFCVAGPLWHPVVGLKARCAAAKAAIQLIATSCC